MSTPITTAVPDLAAGTYVKGIPLSDTTFLTTTTFGQVRSIMRDPRAFSDPKRRAVDSDLEEEAGIHELIQRALTGNKKANVPRYAEYIEQLVSGSSTGVLPPVHAVALFGELEVVLMGGTSYVLVPTGEKLLTIDGETQLTAHYTVDDQADPELKKAHREFPLAMVVHHGITVETARQFFHDLNVLAVRPNSSLGLAMDSKDPLTKIVGDLELQVPFLTGRVDRQARQLSKRSTKVVTFGALRQAVLNITFGMAGVQYGARPAPLEDIDLTDVQAIAKDWLKDFFDEFAAQVVDRDNSLAGTAPVLAAIGAMGNQLLKVSPEHRPGLRQTMLNDLRQVDWTKGPNWAGIAGKFTAKGAFSVGGTKEVGYAVFNVLTDSQNAGYARIRGGGTLEATAAPSFEITTSIAGEA